MNPEAMLAGKPEANVLSPSDEWQSTTVGPTCDI